MRKFLKISILLITLYCLLFIVVPSTQAQGEIFAGMRECREKGNCTLDDFLLLGVNAANIIMKIVGVAALAMFVVGGIHWLTAGGRESQIKRGKAIIAGAVMGLFLVFFSWFIVKNKVCMDGGCVSKCIAYYGDKGYECTEVAECNPNWEEEKFDECISNKGCMRGLCPGAKNNVCCKQ
jgi:hypothetical protein